MIRSALIILRLRNATYRASATSLKVESLLSYSMLFFDRYRLIVARFLACLVVCLSISIGFTPVKDELQKPVAGDILLVNFILLFPS